MKLSVAKLLEGEKKGQEVTLKGWVRTFRANRFIAVNDGSTINNIQCVVDFEKTDESLLKRVNTGAAIAVKGTLVASLGKGQSVEIQVTELEILAKVFQGKDISFDDTYASLLAEKVLLEYGNDNPSINPILLENSKFQRLIKA